METSDVLRLTQTVLFVAVGAWAFVRWRRQGTDADRWLAATFGVLALGVAVSTAAGQVPDGDGVQLLRKANLFVVSWFPFLLVRFVDALQPVRPLLRRLLGAAVIAIGTSALFLPSVPAPDEPRDLVYRAWVSVLAVIWLVVLPWVAARLWRAGAGLPTIPRRRLRTLSAGVATLSLVLLFAGAIEDPTSPLGIGVSVGSAAAALLFLIGFAPPRWLRTVWRQPEEARFQEIAVELVATGDAREVAQLMAPYAREVLGAHAAEIHDQGTCLARDGDPNATTSLPDPVTIPLATGRIIVWPDPYLRVVGEDDLVALRRVALLVDLALARGALQQVALLVGNDDVGDVVHEVLQRAQQQLHARTCALLLDHDGTLEVAATVGDASLVGGVEQWIDMLDDDAEDRPLLVPVSTENGPRGVLAVWFDADGHQQGRDRLARTLGTFLGLALAMQHRRSLELDLVRELQQASDARRDFIASVSHELRTPLTTIGGFTHALLQHGDRLDEDQRRDMLERIALRTQSLSMLVEQLLEVAADAGRSVGPPRLARVVLRDVVAAAVTMVRTESDRTIDVAVVDDDVWADAERVRAIVVELLRNAIKFSDAPVVVTATRLGPDVRIAVRDQGIGLRPSEARHVFDPFYRANRSVQDAIPGTGVGLALVRGQVAALGGQVGVDSEPDKGSTFWFTLPAVREDLLPRHADGTVVPTHADGTVVPTHADGTVVPMREATSQG